MKMSFPERLAMWVAYRLPRQVVYWATCRLIAHASYVRPRTEMDRLTPADCLSLWWKEE